MGNFRSVTVGSVNGEPVNVDVRDLGSAVAVRVVLDEPYDLADRPSDFPTMPEFTGAAHQYRDSPQVILAGSTISVLKAEALALVSMGAASYA